MMFEKRTMIDNSREADGPREKHYSIELTDKEHMEKLEATRLVYRPIPKEENMNPELKEKFDKARELTKDTKIIKLKEDNKNVRKKSQTSKKTAKKTNPKPNTTAVAQIQAKL